MDAKMLYVGMDGLDVAFQGALGQRELNALEDAKERARAQSGPVVLELGPGRVKVQVMPVGRKEGFAFTLDTGPDGELIWVKRSIDLQQWNLFVSVRSAALATLGYERVKNRLLARLNGMGARILSESINRVDVAVDFLAPGFQLDPAQFVAHPRCRRRQWGAMEETPGEECLVNWHARAVSSVTIGAMPNRQVIVYDKRREAIDKRKLHWFEIWGIPKDDKRLKVWRIEVRAGKNYLLDFGLRTFDDLDRMCGDILRVATEQVRMLDAEDENPNVSRRRAAEIWNQARQAFLDVLAAPEEHVGPSKVRLLKRSEAWNCYVGMIGGMAASIAAAMGVQDDDPEAAAAIAYSAMRACFLNDPERYKRALKRARDRLVFITEGVADEHLSAA